MAIYGRAGKVDTKQLAKGLVATGMAEKVAKDVAKNIKDGQFSISAEPGAAAKMHVPRPTQYCSSAWVGSICADRLAPRAFGARRDVMFLVFVR